MATLKRNVASKETQPELLALVSEHCLRTAMAVSTFSPRAINDGKLFVARPCGRARATPENLARVQALLASEGITTLPKSPDAALPGHGRSFRFFDNELVPTQRGSADARSQRSTTLPMSSPASATEVSP